MMAVRGAQDEKEKREDFCPGCVAQTNTLSHIITHTQHKRALQSRIHRASLKTHFKTRNVAPVFMPILLEGLVSSVGDLAAK